MKVKLLKKIRSRIVSVDFYGKIYADIEYYDKHDDIECYRVFDKGQLLYVIRDMFGDFFANVVERRNKKANFRRAKKKLNYPVKYSWEENK